MTFGKKLLLLRKEKGMSQDDLGKAIGTSKDVYGKYERDAMSPSKDVAIKLADVFNCSLDYLLRDDYDLKTVVNAETLPEKFVELLNKFERLAKEDQEHVIAVIEAFIAKEKL